MDYSQLSVAGWRIHAETHVAKSPLKLFAKDGQSQWFKCPGNYSDFQRRFGFWLLAGKPAYCVLITMFSSTSIGSRVVIVLASRDPFKSLMLTFIEVGLGRQST